MTIPLFLIPLVAGLVAQALKPLLSRNWRREQAKTMEPRLRYGGMPSAHIAFSASLVVVAGIVEGVSSAAFAIAIALFILVLDDALRLRIFLGRYGVAIRRLLQSIPEKDRAALPPIESRMGHTIPEALGGMAVGLLVTWVIFLVEGWVTRPS